jgi:hypothetical protein
VSSALAAGGRKQFGMIVELSATEESGTYENTASSPDSRVLEALLLLLKAKYGGLAGLDGPW